MSVSSNFDGEGSRESGASPGGGPSAGDPDVADDGAIDVDGDGGGDVRRSSEEVRHDDDVDDDDEYSIISGASAGHGPRSGERNDAVLLSPSSCEGGGDGKPSPLGNDLPSPTPVDVDVANDGDVDVHQHHGAEGDEEDEDEDEGDGASGEFGKEAASVLPGAFEESKKRQRAGIELSAPSGMQEFIDTLQHDEGTSLLLRGGDPIDVGIVGDGSPPTRIILPPTPRMTRTEKREALARARQWHENRMVSLSASDTLEVESSGAGDGRSGHDETITTSANAMADDDATCPHLALNNRRMEVTSSGWNSISAAHQGSPPHPAAARANAAARGASPPPLAATAAPARPTAAAQRAADARALTNAPPLPLPPYRQPAFASGPRNFHETLFDVVSAGEHDRVVSWLYHGRGFAIHDKDAFIEDILPKYFDDATFASFARRLETWNFVRIPRGPEMGAYYNGYFRRDRPELLSKMSYVVDHRLTPTAARGGRGQDGETSEGGRSGGGETTTASANAPVERSGENESSHVDTLEAEESTGGRSGGSGTKTTSENAASVLRLGLNRGTEVASAGLAFIRDRDWHRPVTITLPVWCVLLIGVFLLAVSVVMILLLAVSVFLVGINLGGSGCGMSTATDTSFVPQSTNALGQCHSDTRLPQNVLDAITSEIRRHAQTVQPQTSKGSDKRATDGNGNEKKQKNKGKKNKKQKKKGQKNKGNKNKKQKKNKQKNKNQKEKQGNMAEKERKP